MLPDDDTPTEDIGERIIREHAEALTVGARVRVRLSGECIFNLHHSRLGGDDSGILWHVVREDARVGTIIRIVDIDHHRYHVKFDEWLTAFMPTDLGGVMQSLMCRTGRYAAAELVPLSDDETRQPTAAPIPESTGRPMARASASS